MTPPSLQTPPRPPTLLSSSVRHTPRFGGEAIPLDPVTRRVDAAFRWLGASRTREMLIEDLVGFGVLRTGLDLFRGRFYGQQGKDQLNIPMAGERFLREVASIFTDNVSSGIAAFALGKVAFDKVVGPYSNRFTSFDTIETFQHVLGQAQDKQDFLQGVIRLLGRGDEGVMARLKPVMTWEALTDAVPEVAAQKRKTAATAIAKALGQETFDVVLSGQAFAPKTFPLEDLLSDLADLHHHVPAGEASGWRGAAEALLQKTHRAKHWKLGALGVGIGLTLAVPYAIRWVTQKLYKIDYYPGEIGLKKPLKRSTGSSLNAPAAFQPFIQARQASPTEPSPTKSHGAKLFPYLSDTLKRGNLLPTALTLTPLIFALGLFDTAAMRFVKPGKGFLKKLRNMVDFGKAFPFTTQQQMASMFAFLIMSRLSSARGPNEFRERLVDSYLGWGLWILGTPIIKRFSAKVLQGLTGSHLLKTVDGQLRLKSRQEIEALMTHLPQKIQQRSLAQNIWMGAASTVFTMLLLGVVEPLAAIQWTKHNGAREAG